MFDPLDKQISQHKKCECCEEYVSAVATGLFRKKEIGRDMKELMKTGLNRCLTTIDLIAYGLGPMLGGSIYVLNGVVMKTRTGPGVFLAYILAAFAALLNSLNYAELACRIPKAGSAYVYTYFIMGEFPAFITGWAILLEYILGISLVARCWSSMLDSIANNQISMWAINNVGRLSHPGGILAEYYDFVGVSLIIILSSISCCGIRGSAKLTAVSIFVNVGVLIVTSIYMFVYSKPEYLSITSPNITVDPLSPNPNFLPFGLPGLIGGTAICFNVFIGFDAISTCAEEAKNPNYSLPIANIVSVIIVAILTTLSSLALTMYYPWFHISTESSFLSALKGNHVNGGPDDVRNGMFYFVGVGSLVGLIACLTASLIAAPRISYAMAQDGVIPTMFSHLCQPFKTPAISTTFIALLTALLTLIFSVNSLADFLSLGTLIAYSITAIAIICIRYRKQSDSPQEVIETDRSISGGTEKDKPVAQVEYYKKRIDKPGYVKNPYAHFMPECMLKVFNSGSPGDTVIILMAVYVVLNGVLIMCLTIGAKHELWPVWRIVCVVLILTLLIFCIVLMSIFKQFGPPYKGLFQLPYVPLFPCVTVTINVFLMSELSWVTWIRFTIWIVIGLLIYFGFGVMNTYRLFKDNEINNSQFYLRDPFDEKKSNITYLPTEMSRSIRFLDDVYE
ncbi:Cationic amino acid transporter 4 [Schistosoma japonicum]|nr:Cationic amino acid transporter 4 [Schistosoma japonicum]